MAIAKALVRHVEGHTLLAKAATHHWVPLDSPQEGGQPTGANSPVQMLLIACAGCVAIDVVNILVKSRQEFRALEIEIEGQRRDTPPKIFRRLDYRIRASGPGLREETLRRAVELSLTKYCSVSLSLDRTVEFFAHLTVNGTPRASWQVMRDPALYAAGD